MKALLIMLSLLGANTQPMPMPADFADPLGALEFIYNQESVSKAINVASRQKMLTQYMTKCYMAQLLEVQSSKSSKDLARAVELFETRLAELKGFASTQSITDKLKTVQTEWEKVKPIFTGKVTLDGAHKLVEVIDPFLEVCQGVVVSLQAQAAALPDMHGSITNEEITHLIAMAGRQRMVSQRISWIYLAKVAMPDAREALRAKLRVSMGEYETSLQEMMASSATPADVRAKLKSLFGEWMTFSQKYLPNRTPSKDQLREFLDLGNELLTHTDEVTAMYAHLVNIELGTDQLATQK